MVRRISLLNLAVSLEGTLVLLECSPEPKNLSPEEKKKGMNCIKSSAGNATACKSQGHAMLVTGLKHWIKCSGL
jgi:hypothetical protein